MKGADNTLAKYEEADWLWDLNNSTMDAFNQNKTTASQDIHTVTIKVKQRAMTEPSNPLNSVAKVTNLNNVPLNIILVTSVTKWAT